MPHPIHDAFRTWTRRRFIFVEDSATVTLTNDAGDSLAVKSTALTEGETVELSFP